MKKFFCFIWLVCSAFPMAAQEALSLDSCRALAISNNKELLISREKINAAHYQKKRHSPITFPTSRLLVDICAAKKNYLY